MCERILSDCCLFWMLHRFISLYLALAQSTFISIFFTFSSHLLHSNFKSNAKPKFQSPIIVFAYHTFCSIMIHDLGKCRNRYKGVCCFGG